LIVKTNTGKSFGGCVNYVLEKEKAEVLHVEGVRMDTPKHMTSDFNRVRLQNPNLGKAVLHTSVSFPEADRGKITDEMMKNIAKDYANKFGLEQYAVVKHNDAKHEHFHIVANRVKYDGQTVSDNFIASRGVELSKQLEVKYNLSRAQAQNKDIKQTNLQALKGNDKVKYDIFQAVQKELPSCRNLEQLQEKLKSHGIEVTPHRQETGRIYGVSYKKDNITFAGSKIDKSLSYGSLNNRFENNLNLKNSEQSKYEIFQAVQKELPSCRNLEQLQEKLKSHGIEITPHKQETGRIYGVSYKMDNMIFTGSSIDKSLSYGSLNKSFENNLKSQNPEVKEKIFKTVEKELKKYDKWDLKGLTEKLKAQGIEITYDQGKTGRIYDVNYKMDGVTFKGSELGLGYSELMKKLDAKMNLPKKSQPSKVSEFFRKKNNIKRHR
jgi:hypothetical protein